MNAEPDTRRPFLKYARHESRSSPRRTDRILLEVDDVRRGSRLHNVSRRLHPLLLHGADIGQRLNTSSRVTLVLDLRALRCSLIEANLTTVSWFPILARRLNAFSARSPGVVRDAIRTIHALVRTIQTIALHSRAISSRVDTGRACAAAWSTWIMPDPGSDCYTTRDTTVTANSSKYT